MVVGCTYGRWWLAGAVVWLLAGGGAGRGMAQTIRAVGTYHNIGLDVTFDAPAPPDTVVGLSIRKSGAEAFVPGHPLARLDDTRFAGSVFALEAGTPYEVALDFGGVASNTVVAVTTRSEHLAEPSGPVYHVDPVAGSDRHEGLRADDAFQSLQRALQEAAPGVTLLLHDGRYREGDLVLTASGTATNPIVIRPAPGAKPVIDGTASGFVPVWTLHDATAGLYRTPCESLPNNAYLDGEQFFRYDSYANLRDRRWEQDGGYFADGTMLFARFPRGGSPAGHTVTIPAYSTGLTLMPTVAFVQITGLEFCYMGFRGDHRGIDLRGAQSNLIDRCVFHQTGVAISLRHGASFNTIQHCVVSEAPVARWSWLAVKEGSPSYEMGGVGIFGGNGTPVGNVIRHNVFSNMFDGAGLLSDDEQTPTTALDVHDNRFIDCGDDAIEADGYGINVRLYRNRMDNVRAGISVAPCGPGPTYLMRNVVGPSPAVGADGRMPVKFNSNSSQVSQWIYLYHNTAFSDVARQPAFSMFASQARWTNVIARNNIFVGTGAGFYGMATPNPIDFDSDNLYAGGVAPFGWWEGARCQTFRQFQQTSSQEARGWSLNPGFRDTRGGDYGLRLGSPMVDRGVRIHGVNDDFKGRAPDLGAFELEVPGNGGRRGP